MMLTSTQIGELAAQFFIAGVGTLCFAVLFACPRKSLFFCGLVGAVGWFVYELAVMLGADSAAASLLAVIPLTLLTRVFAITLKMPVTVFLLSGIFPLVPGAGIYYTAYYFIQAAPEQSVMFTDTAYLLQNKNASASCKKKAETRNPSEPFRPRKGSGFCA